MPDSLAVVLIVLVTGVCCFSMGFDAGARRTRSRILREVWERNDRAPKGPR